MKEKKSEWKHSDLYEKPKVIYEKELETLAGNCGEGTPNTYLGGNNCKGEGACAVLYS